MIVIKLYSFELTDRQLYDLCEVLAGFLGMRGYPLALTADPERGRQVELILTQRDKLLAP